MCVSGLILRPGSKVLIPLQPWSNIGVSVLLLYVCVGRRIVWLTGSVSTAAAAEKLHLSLEKLEPHLISKLSSSVTFKTLLCSWLAANCSCVFTVLLTLYHQPVDRATLYYCISAQRKSILLKLVLITNPISNPIKQYLWLSFWMWIFLNMSQLLESISNFCSFSHSFFVFLC